MPDVHFKRPIFFTYKKSSKQNINLTGGVSLEDWHGILSLQESGPVAEKGDVGKGLPSGRSGVELGT